MATCSNAFRSGHTCRCVLLATVDGTGRPQRLRQFEARRHDVDGEDSGRTGGGGQDRAQTDSTRPEVLAVLIVMCFSFI
jgi:hypothetical protein